MKHSRMGFILVAGLSLVSAMGCQNKVHDENLQLHQQNRELQSQLSDRDDSPSLIPH